MKFKRLSLAAVLTAVLCLSGNLFAVLSGGGTQANPYLIQSRADFDEFANPANAATYWADGKYTKLMCDLNLAGTTYTQAVIAPDIDSADSGFTGVIFTGIFDGDGHVVCNLTITASTKYFVGLFGDVDSGGEVKNLGVENANITGDNIVGGLVGYNGGTLASCYATGNVSGTGRYCDGTGGLVGYNKGTLTSCYATGNVSGTGTVGGLVGENKGSISDSYSYGSISNSSNIGGGFGGLVGYNEGSITYCHASGTVNGIGNVGGLVGISRYYTISNCYHSGPVSAVGGFVGGLVGNSDTVISCCYNTGSVNGGSYIGGLVGESFTTINNSYNTGSVSGINRVGGLVGSNEDNEDNVTNCYSTGSVSGTDGVGGLIGYQDKSGISINKCYSTGTVIGVSNTGGFLGSLLSGTISNCFWDVNTSGKAIGIGYGSSAGVYDRTTTLMQQQATFTDAGWDFVGESANGLQDYWQIVANDYPRLVWETVTAPPAPTGVSASDGTNTSKVLIKWTASSGATAYNVYRNTFNNSVSAVKINKYDVTTTGYNDAPVLGTIYWYWVKAKNIAGASDFSNGDSGYPATTVILPSAPTNISATDGTYTDKVTIAWTASSGATAYDVYRYTSNNSASSAKINSSDVTATSYNDTSAVVGTTYWYWVKAKNTSGASGFSNGDSGYRAATVTPPSAPTNVLATDGIYGDKVAITWTASSGATAYDVYRFTSDTSASSVKINTSDVTVTSYNDTSAVAGTTYWYWVKAKNTGGTSGFSNGDSGYKKLPPQTPTVSVQKCSVTAGNNNLDGISFSGSLNAADGDFMAAMNGNLVVSVDSDLMSSPKTFTFPITAATYKKCKFSGKNSNGTFSFDTKNNKFSFAAKKTNLTGLSCPITVTITIGNYAAQTQLEEAIVNGKKPIPFQLIMGVQNNLIVTKYKLKVGKTAGTDTFTVQGIFTVDGTIDITQPFVISIGSQHFTISGGVFFDNKGVYSCKNAQAKEGGLVTAKFDKNKCTFTLSITKANIGKPGAVVFELDCLGNSLKNKTTINLN